jgi:acetyl-CoA carboxylase biotin carboxyl carrier protein
MDLRKLKTLIDLVSESSISELEITEADGKVRIVKAMAPAAVPAMAMPPLPAAAVATPATATAAGVAAAPAPGPGAAAVPPDADKVVKSPMVGTFYRAASPGAKPFIDVGDVVKQGSPVCIIEAMKIMNEIESEVAGTIAKVLCENGQAVEYGQPLFILE